MWKSQGNKVTVQAPQQDDDDDWETDADFKNDISEEQQRWGAKTVEGSLDRSSDPVDLQALKNDVMHHNETKVKEEYESKPTSSYGYGGKFGVQHDRMDKSALRHEADTDVRHKPVMNYRLADPDVPVTSKADIRERFESINETNEAEERRKREEEREMRLEQAEREKLE
eukprot:Ihof_evm1s732 gene=Ihof_evmTU1s732